MAERKNKAYELLMVDIKLDKSNGAEQIKNALEKFGFTTEVLDVKWHTNKYAQQDSSCIIQFKSAYFAKRALEELNGQILPDTLPLTKFKLIAYPPNSDNDKHVYATKCCHGLILSGYDPTITGDLVRVAVSRYYSSLIHIKVLDAPRILPRAAIWFENVKDRDLAYKQLSGHEMKFGDAPRRPLGVQIIPPGATDVPNVVSDTVRVREVQMLHEADVTSSLCKQTNCGPAYTVPAAFQPRKLPGIRPESQLGVSSSGLFALPLQPNVSSLGQQQPADRNLRRELDHEDGKPMMVFGRGRARGRKFNTGD